MNDRTFVVVGNPENRRIEFFQQALARRRLPVAMVLSYESLLNGQGSIEEIPPTAILRIDSPGENFAVEKLLLTVGEHAAESEGSPAISRQQIANLPDDPGRILYPRQWYLGFRETLSKWHEYLARSNELSCMSWPPDIELMFDKPSCHKLCQAAGIAVPEVLDDVSGFDELITKMQAGDIPRVFIKLATGSSASGVVALHARNGRLEATTSAEILATGGEVRLYNSLQIRRYTELSDIRVLVDTLAGQRIHVERWLPKASLNHQVFDLRVVLIHHEPQHMVVRQSRGPITNLHLGNRRGNLAALMERLSESQRQEFLSSCRAVAQQFPNSLQLSLDILFTLGFRRHYLLEVNAFGDLLPKVEYRGLDTYEAQIEAVLAAR